MNYSDYSSIQSSHLFVLLAAIWGIALIIGLAVYLLEATAFYKMYKKANVPHAWLAYIPFAQYWPFFWTIKKSAWNILWLLLPVAGGAAGGIIWGIMQNGTGALIFSILIIACSIYLVVLAIIWQVRLFKAFGINPLWLLGMIGTIIPFVGFLVSIGFIVLYCYMGFSREVEYHPEFDEPIAS